MCICVYTQMVDDDNFFFSVKWDTNHKYKIYNILVIEEDIKLFDALKRKKDIKLN